MDHIREEETVELADSQNAGVDRGGSREVPEPVAEAGDQDRGETVTGDADEMADPVQNGGESESGEKKKSPERFCSMCRRPESKTGKLVELPGGMLCCSDCMQKSFDTMQTTMQNNNLNLGDLLSKIPGISFIDLTGSMQQPVKKTKEKAETEKKEAEVQPLGLGDIPAPHRIKARLDDYVIGQERAKKYMSVAVYNHYKRVLAGVGQGKAAEEEVEIQKSNMLMIGPTGSGKTYLVQTLARLLDVPLAMTDATSLTEAGYIGDDIESVVSKLLAAADNDVDRAEHGIIFIDEIDKIAKKKNAHQRDVSGEAVQQGLLKLLEGSRVEVPVGATSKNAMVPLQTIDTTNILFICGGAFPELEEIIRERLTKKSSLGFQSELRDRFDGDKNLLARVEVEDLRNFGMIPEFLGRLPIIFSLESLTEDMLVGILREPKNAILRQYQKLMELDEVRLTFEEGALRAIARKALEKNTGARALRAIIEEFMLDIMYETPKDDSIGEVIITEDYVEGRGGPRIQLRGN